MENESWETETEGFIHFKVRRGILYVFDDLKGTESAVVIQNSNRDLFGVLMSLIIEGFTEQVKRRHHNIIDIVEECSSDDIQFSFAELLGDNPHDWNRHIHLDLDPKDGEPTPLQDIDDWTEPEPSVEPEPTEQTEQKEECTCGCCEFCKHKHHHHHHPDDGYFDYNHHMYNFDGKPHGNEYFQRDDETTYPEFDNVTEDGIMEENESGTDGEPDNGIDPTPKPFDFHHWNRPFGE